MTSQQLNGSQRVLLDGLITDDECKELQLLSNVSRQCDIVDLPRLPISSDSTFTVTSVVIRL